MMIVACAVCGKKMRRWPSHLKRTIAPVCSRHCNGKLRAKELIRHSHKGRAAWTADSLASYRRKMSGRLNPAWRGGSYIEPGKGYRMVRMPDHPRARANGYVLEHILVAERLLGRPLAPTEEVHHRNHRRADNRPENLEVYSSHKEHWMSEHYATVAAARDAANSRRRTKVPERV
jgi:hypothetical protein